MVAEAGRDPGAFGISGRVTLRDDLEATLGRVREWDALGASHVSINTMGIGLAPDEHAPRLADLARAWQRSQTAA